MKDRKKGGRGGRERERRKKEGGLSFLVTEFSI
jgi:hypothetical protein